MSVGAKPAIASPQHAEHATRPRRRAERRPLPHRLLAPLVAAVDALIVFDAFSVAYLLRFEAGLSPVDWPPAPPAEYLRAMAVVAWCWVLLFHAAGLYDLRRTRSAIDTVHLVVRTVTLGTAVMLSVGFFYRDFSFSRLVCVYAWVLAIALFCAFRLALNRARERLHRRGLGLRRVLLVGSRSLAAHLARRMGQRVELGYRVVGAVDDGPRASDLPCPVLGGLEDLEDVVEREGVDRVFIAHPVLGHQPLLRTVETCDRLGVPLGIVPPTWDLLIDYRDFEEVDGIPLVSVREKVQMRAYEAVKRAVDTTVAAAGLVLLSPVFAAVAVVVRIESGSPVLFGQWRVGREGRPFRMWKFRTMVHDAEARLGALVDVDRLREPVFKLQNDPRVTRVGRFLRRTSLDELPQLWNVLRGEMSLVGPRPEEERVVRRYGVQERRRLKVTPGMTGLQQVECRGTCDLAERVRRDIIYLRKRSLLLDLWILARTVLVVLAGRGAR